MVYIFPLCPVDGLDVLLAEGGGNHYTQPPLGCPSG